MHPRPRISCAVLTAAALVSLEVPASSQVTDPFPAEFELSSLLPINGGDGSRGFVLNGIDPVDSTGISVSSAGDVNGDGVDDLIVGAETASPDGNIFAGESYVVFGATGVGASGVIELGALDGTDGFVLNGIDADDFTGFSVSSAGDVNADGVDDLIIGAYVADPNGVENAGRSFVVFGAPGLGASGVIELSSLDGSNGFILNGIDPGDGSGISVSSAGDVNADGIDDLIIGAWGADATNAKSSAGESYVVFGAPGLGASGVIELSSLDGSNGFVLNGVDIGDFSGRSVSSAGDVNGDAIDDLIIGAFQADDPNGLNSGESYVVFGAPGIGASGVIELSSLDGANGFVLNGIDGFDDSGRSVSSAGDVNGDGIDDLIIGAYGADPNGLNSGESAVVFGAPGLGASGSIELSALDGSNGFLLHGIDADDFSGNSVSSAGDVNGDGVDDLIIGASAADPNGNDFAGESYVVFGATGVGASGVIELGSLDGTNGLVLNGIDAGDRSGWSVSSAGDVNGDCIDDLIIGAKDADPNGNSDAGESYVAFGRTTLVPGLFYRADFSQKTSIDHETPGNPLEPSPQAGANFQIGYPLPPASDSTRNYLETTGDSLISSDFGGEHFFFTDSIDVSTADSVTVGIVNAFVGTNSFNDVGSEFIRYVYGLDSGPLQQFFSWTGAPNGPDLDASTTIDTSGASSLVVGVIANVDGEGDGWEMSSVTVQAVRCSSADLAAPFGTVDAADVVAFLDCIDPTLAAPTGIADFFDVAALLQAAESGCP